MVLQSPVGLDPKPQTPTVSFRPFGPTRGFGVCGLYLANLPCFKGNPKPLRAIEGLGLLMLRVISPLERSNMGTCSHCYPLATAFSYNSSMTMIYTVMTTQETSKCQQWKGKTTANPKPKPVTSPFSRKGCLIFLRIIT